MISSLFLATVLSAGVARADQASNFDVSPEVAEQYGCGPQCQAMLAQANEMDLNTFGRDFDFEFYSTAGNFSTCSSRPGDLLKLQLLDNVPIPGASAVYKIQYTSEDVDGSVVPVTGYVAFPETTSPEPHNLVAWAHGTSGMFRGCAPSTSDYLYDAMSWSPLIQSGYAIVATDYAGLGNNYTEHRYTSNHVHANDMLYSVVAAKKAFPGRMSDEWVSFGHSQGGSAVWKLSEHPDVQSSDSGYLGGVALAPAATRIMDQVKLGLEIIQNSNSTASSDFPSLSNVYGLIVAITRLWPQYDPSWVTADLKQRLELANIGQYCISAIMGLTMDLTIDQIFETFDISDDSYIQQFNELVGPAQGDSASKPLLVLTGLKDPVILPDPVKAAYESACGYGNSVHLSLYPEADHNSIVVEGVPEWMQFIAERFAGVPYEEACV